MPDGDAMLTERAALAPATPHKLSIDEFMPIAAQSTRNLELVEGEIFEMPWEGPDHASDVKRIMALMDRLLAGSGLTTLANVALGYQSRTALGPDIVAFTSYPRGLKYIPAENARWIVEVAYSTVSRDRRFKRAAYARFGAPHYWIVDPEQARIFVFSDPVDGDYRSERTLRAGDTLPCPFAPERTVAVADLLG